MASGDQDTLAVGNEDQAVASQSNITSGSGESRTDVTNANDDNPGDADQNYMDDGSDEEGRTLGFLPRVVKGTIIHLGEDLSIDYYMNPCTMLMSILVIWGFAIWCATDDESGTVIQEWQDWIVYYWTWFYVMAFIVFGTFTIYLLFSRFGDIKLGPKDEPPRFGIGSWFAMLFSAGVGVGLYFYGVAEPVWHYYYAKNGDNRYYTDGDNLEMALDAMNVSWFHWGLTASCCYCVVGLPLAYFTHVKNAPLKFSSAFIPLLGKKYANGFIGDVIDAFAVVGTMFGVSTSLGLGVMQLNAFLNFMAPDTFAAEDTDLRIGIIWVITLFATISVFTGLDVGIRRLSEGNFAFCLILLLYVYVIVDPFYLTNLFIQTVGYHVQHLIEITFFTDAFQQAGFAEDEDYEAFMSWWTVFYWGWWIAWSPFVGIFIAQISRGRTIREFILGNVLAPTLFTSLWLCVFGGVGLYNELAFDGRVDNYADVVTCPGSSSSYSSDAMTNMTMTTNATMEYSAYGRHRGNNVVYLECFSTELMLFEMLDQYPLGGLMNVFAGIGLVTYFVTSSDSASHVIDVLTANGNEEPPKIQRIFWAMSEGAVASVLLSLGGSASLSALQTVSIASGLPFCAILLALCYAFVYALKIDTGEIDPEAQINWKLNFWDSSNPQITLLATEENGHNPRKGYLLSCLRALFIPCYENWTNYHNIAAKDSNNVIFKLTLAHRVFWGCLFFVPPLCVFIFLLIGIGFEGWAYLALVFYIFYVGIGAWNRSRIRSFYNIDGNIFCDCLAHTLCFASWAIAQEQQQILNVDADVATSVPSPRHVSDNSQANVELQTQPNGYHE